MIIGGVATHLTSDHDAKPHQIVGKTLDNTRKDFIIKITTAL